MVPHSHLKRNRRLDRRKPNYPRLIQRLGNLSFPIHNALFGEIQYAIGRLPPRDSLCIGPLIINPQNDSIMKFIGIEIEKKTDILAMAAFLLSLGSIAGQAILLMRGSEIVLDGPRQIILFFESRLSSRNFLNAVSTQIYVNNGSSGFDDILKSETLLLTIAGKRIQLESQDSVDSTRNGDKLVFRSRQAWKPAKIKAGDFISNETLYVPYPSPRDSDENAIDRADVEKLLSRSSDLKIELIAKTYGGDKLTSNCLLKAAEIQLSLEEKGWASLACNSKATNFVDSLSRFFSRSS